MKRRTLGGTGISVSEFAFGAMMFGDMANNDVDEGVRIIHRALDAGINFVDTADIYSAGGSEEIVGKALKGRRDDVVLATKAHGSMGPDPNHGGTSRRWLVREVENSLRRLGTDHIDLYQMHRPDPATDIDETLGALTDLVRAGKVRAVGSSTFPAELIVEAQWVSERRGHVRFRTEQPPYSILARGVEAAVLPTTQKYGMGVLTWGPLSAGWLSGRYRSAEDLDPSTGGRTTIERHKFDISLPENARKLQAVTDLAKLADEAGLPLPHLALAFVRSHPAVTSVIIGPRTMDQLDSLLTGADVTLTPDVLDRIDEIVPPGTDLNPADNYYTPPALTNPALRRR
ncbi:aldo/keto reductase [Sphaerisporangium rubeum]|uniref:Aryl-alcohol dehydrogenase-like predicted oxidoreductase n=1 Tax=Sphaerisporangium rubeum TaxID=321317 RepID=A0A7X0M842_9ACTN|nr:aldo/keto reductase [Sphaerisporangium rubeum]MBB6474977.1 aryl-alcohol dehydrogenase-like predicted oxidoreductase [Sphaerisporangium rubeum]